MMAGSTSSFQLILMYNYSMKNEPKIHRVYKHFKGDLYIVEDICEHSETSEKMVLYRALYGEGKLYVRPLKMFLSEVDHDKYPQAKQKYRFELQKIERTDHKSLDDFVL